jgi:hypothetical protein
MAWPVSGAAFAAHGLRLLDAALKCAMNRTSGTEKGFRK